MQSVEYGAIILFNPPQGDIIIYKKLEEDKMAVTKQTYPVIGLSCASCVNKVESVLNKTEGVASANVNFASEKVTVEYDDEKIDIKGLEKVVKSLGYELIT